MWGLLLAVGSSSACGASEIPSPPGRTPHEATADTSFGKYETFEIHKAELRSSGANEAFLTRVSERPYAYFRLFAPQMENRICKAFEELRWRLPVVAVHGDAHVEQLVVTADTYGLEDFDRSGYGPLVVDVVRYATALRLACREVGCADSGQVVDRYLDAYREALDRPPPTLPTPRVVERLRRTTPQSRLRWLDWASSLMRPLDSARERSAVRDWTAFAEVLRTVEPGRRSRELELVRVGSLSMGLGSATEEKLLFRVTGPTDAPEDDEILEAREGDARATATCIWRGHHGDPLVLMFMAILGRRMPDFYGFLPVTPTQRDYWVQSWTPGYRELGVGDLESETELAEVSVDAAHQLAGHFWVKFPAPVRSQQRVAQLRAFDLTRTRAKELSQQYAEETLAAWRSFAAER